MARSRKTKAPDPGATDALRDQLRAAAEAFSESDDDVVRILETIASDVARARGQRIPIFPVMHHSPASAVHMVRWLRDKAPKLVFVEMCEDLRPRVADLKDCTLPVALQAFAGDAVGFPPEWTPLSVVAPLTEFSAEYQAMAYALQESGVELVFVDRAVDHVFQWRDPADDPNAPVDDEEEEEEEEDEEEARMHGSAVGLEIGEFVPTFGEFRDFLLDNARMSQFEEWTNLYIEEPTIGASTETYREVMFLVGSLFRRLGSTPQHREEIRRRDRFMWTRIKEVLADRGVDPGEAVFICGAAHAVCDECPEWGLDNDERFEIPERSATRWQYGFIPSSYAAIEAQFGHARGAVSLAEARWRKAVAASGLQPFTMSKSAKKGKAKAPPAPSAPTTLAALLADPPSLSEADREELLGWCTEIVDAARKNRYLATTADSIAIYETAILLARVRARKRPSAYDFMDAAETCLEKGAPPGRRSVRQLVSKMLGGDRVGQVGYDSLPPLVQDVYDRLAPLGITAKTRRVTRVLMDFRKHPELRACSALLWRLNWLLPNSRVARPIMGELKLGAEPAQESWDVALHGAEQRAVIQLSFEGVTIEQVLENRFREAAFGADASTVDALRAVEGSIILLDSPRLTEQIGQRSVALLTQERGAGDAAEIFERIRRLVHHERTTDDGAPGWLKDFVATGYQHYTTQLPEGFRDRGVAPEDLGAMLSFVFTLEGLALAMGCSRSQLMIALDHAAVEATDPEKLGLLWAAEWLVQIRDDEGVRSAFAEILDHPLGRTAYPRYLSGFLLSLAFASRAATLAVDLLGKAFAALPDRVLLPWMPALIDRLRPRSADVLPSLFKEFGRSAPRKLADLDAWDPPWMRQPKRKPKGAAKGAAAGAGAQPVARSPAAVAARALLFAHRSAPDAHAAALGFDGTWGDLGDVGAQGAAGAEGTASRSEPGEEGDADVGPEVAPARELLARHGAALVAHARNLGVS